MSDAIMDAPWIILKMIIFLSFIIFVSTFIIIQLQPEVTGCFKSNWDDEIVCGDLTCYKNLCIVKTANITYYNVLEIKVYKQNEHKEVQ